MWGVAPVPGQDLVQASGEVKRQVPLGLGEAPLRTNALEELAHQLLDAFGTRSRKLRRDHGGAYDKARVLRLGKALERECSGDHDKDDNRQRDAILVDQGDDVFQYATSPPDWSYKARVEPLRHQLRAVFVFGAPAPDQDD